MDTEEKVAIVKDRIDAIVQSPLTLDDKLSWHLTAVFGVRSTRMVAPLKQAILLATDDTARDHHIALPDGITFKGLPTATVADLIDNFLLAPYVVTAR